MKILLMSLLILSFVPITGCDNDDESTTAPSAMESEINAAKPYHFVIVINPDTGNWTFEHAQGGSNNPFTDAYAENGYLVVVTIAGKQYFNLSLAKEISIQPNTAGATISIRY